MKNRIEKFIVFVGLAIIPMFFQNCTEVEFQTLNSDPYLAAENNDDGLGNDNGIIDKDDAGNPNPAIVAEVDPTEENEEESEEEENEEEVVQIDCNQNFVINGGFDIRAEQRGIRNKNLATMNGWDVYQTLPGNENGGVSWYTESGAGIEIQKSGVVAPSVNGDFVVELDSHPHGNSNSKMSQDVYLPAGEYVLSFSYRARTRTQNDNGIEVSWDNIAELEMNNTQRSWQNVEVAISTDTPGFHKLSFEATGRQNTLGGLIDAVSIRNAVCLQ